jgi:hypothetical protein
MGEGGCNTFCDCGEMYSPSISKIPTAGVVEVKRGYWKDRYGNKYDNHLYECSACGEEALYKFKVDELGHTRAVQALTSLCSNCGARMDRERKR